MSQLGVPGEPAPVIGGITINTAMRSVFQKVTTSLLKTDMATQKPDTSKSCVQCGRRGVVPGTEYCPDHL